MKKFIALFFLILSGLYCPAQVVINELMSNNQSTITDEDIDYSDWIELFNAGGSTINLHNYSLTDNPDSLQKWEFPNVNLHAGEFLIVWCSGKNRTGANLHTNFSIDSRGEVLFLSDDAGNVIDNISSVLLYADRTYGRYPDGNASFVYLSNATAGTSNTIATALSGVLTELPVFDIPGGLYTSSQVVTLSHADTSVTIHYTLDGSDPTVLSPVYTSPLTVQSRIGDTNFYSLIRTCYNVHAWLPDWNPPASEVFKATVIRARAFKNNYEPGPIRTNTYFIDPGMMSRYGSLPVVSIVSDPKNLFSDTTGIYVPGINYQPNTYHANYYKSWDRPANIEMFLPGGKNIFNSGFRVNINGQSSPSSPQKGINVNASSDYGDAKINYPLFENTTGHARYIQKFEKLKFRAWGSDRAKAMFRDAYCASFMLKSDLDIEAYRPVVVFIDGEYWGLQELRERNRDGVYYESHYFIPKKNPGYDILDGGGNTIIEGDSQHWDDMMNFMSNNPMSVPANYEYIKTQMDVDNFMLNYMNSIYFGRGDWPDQNEAKWRPRIANGRWRWMQWDMESTAGFYLNPWYDELNQAINGSRGYGPSNILNDLLENTEFKMDFINLFADYMNTEFIPVLAQIKVDQLSGELAPFMSEFQDRWQLNYNWQNQLDSIKWWMTLRPDYCKHQIINAFGLTTAQNLTLDVSDTAKGKIKVNTILLDENTTRIVAGVYPWTGQYFAGVRVPLKAIAKKGFRFVEWLPSGDTSQTIFLNLTGDTAVTAMFDVDTNYIPQALPVINEAMSSNASSVADNYGEYDDWVEIYNPNIDTLDVGGYYLTDNLVLPTRFRIMQGNDSTKIPPHGFLLLWIDNNTGQGVLHAPFKFNSGGDFIALIAPDGIAIVDSLTIQNLITDVSYGRSYDASPSFIYFNPSTPGATNWQYNSQNVLINELQTINSSTVADNFGEYNQWIELYNPNADTIDLAGWKISADPLNAQQYIFPFASDSTKIAPYGFKLLWADDQTTQGIEHLNFTLQQGGCVNLIKPNNYISDSACYAVLATDESYGRNSDGNPFWKNFSIPTPDSNNVDLSTQIALTGSHVNFMVYPNPVHGKIYFNQITSFLLYDALGRKLSEGKEKSDFDMSSYENGVYFLITAGGERIRLIRE